MSANVSFRKMNASNTWGENNGRSGWRYLSIFAVVFLVFAGLAACADGDSGNDEADSNEPEGAATIADEPGDADGNDDLINVVVTMPFMPSMVEAVGGDLVEIESIVPEGVDAHTYQPSPGDAQMIAEADIIFVNGAGLEEFLADLIDSAGDVDVPVIELSEGIDNDSGESENDVTDEHEHDEEEHDEEHDHSHDHDHEGGNPHFWLDPGYGIHYVENIAAGLSEVDSSNEDAYQENAGSYIAEIEEFDEWAQGEIDQIPEENRSMVTFHDAFPHFAAHFGLEVVGVVISSPGREPGAQEIARLADEIQEVGVPAVFVEPQFNPSLADSIAEEAGVDTMMIYSDTPPDDGGYLEMMELNVENVVEGLS